MVCSSTVFGRWGDRPGGAPYEKRREVPGWYFVSGTRSTDQPPGWKSVAGSRPPGTALNSHDHRAPGPVALNFGNFKPLSAEPFRSSDGEFRVRYRTPCRAPLSGCCLEVPVRRAAHSPITVRSDHSMVTHSLRHGPAVPPEAFSQQDTVLIRVSLKVSFSNGKSPLY